MRNCDTILIREKKKERDDCRQVDRSQVDKEGLFIIVEYQVQLIHMERVLELEHHNFGAITIILIQRESSMDAKSGGRGGEF